MNFKHIIAISILLLIFSISAISAADLNETDCQTTDTDNTISITGNPEDSNVTGGSFDDLQMEINNVKGTLLDLNKDYYAQNGTTINFTKFITVDGHGHTIDCQNKTSAFYAKNGGVILKNLKIINGRSQGNGGAICCEKFSTFVIINCTFENNWADYSGGAIYSDNLLSIKNSTFISNSAGEDGGAVCCKASIYSDDSVFNNNSAGKNGGAIYSKLDANLLNNILTNNRCNGSGGAVYSKGIENDNVTFISNTASQQGGAIYSLGDVNVDDSIFDKNTAVNSDGGAIYSKGNVKLVNSVLSNNHCGWSGGAVYSKANVIIDTCQIFSNSAFGNGRESRGGAIRAVKNVDVINSIFNDNSVGNYGGAIYGATVNIDMCKFNRNYAGDRGGAIYSEALTTLNDTVLDGNTAGYYGGAIHCQNLDIKSSFFEHNRAEKGLGGAIFSYNDVKIDWKSFHFIYDVRNNSDSVGGSIFSKMVNLIMDGPVRDVPLH